MFNIYIYIYMFVGLATGHVHCVCHGLLTLTKCVDSLMPLDKIIVCMYPHLQIPKGQNMRRMLFFSSISEVTYSNVVTKMS
jgi:hypothetical protein